MICKQILQDKQTHHPAPFNQVNYLIQPKLNLSIGSSLFTSVAAIAGYNVYTSQNDVKLSDLVLSNVEALANAKEGGNECIGCVYTRL